MVAARQPSKAFQAEGRVSNSVNDAQLPASAWNSRLRRSTMRTRGIVQTVFSIAMLLCVLPAVASEGDAPAKRTFLCMRAPFEVPLVMVDGRMRRVMLTKEDVEASPTWDPASGEDIPLSVAAALRAASDEFQRLMRGREGWRMLEVTLRPLCDNRWYYQINWSSGDADEIGMVTIPVLLSGKVPSVDSVESAPPRDCESVP